MLKGGARGAGYGEGNTSYIAQFGKVANGVATLGASFSEGDTSSTAGFGKWAKGMATRKWLHFEPKLARANLGTLVPLKVSSA